MSKFEDFFNNLFLGWYWKKRYEQCEGDLDLCNSEYDLVYAEL